MHITVAHNQLTFAGKTYRCAIGKGGMTSDKKEGDGATPIGTFLLRECWYRADRIEEPQTQLPLKVIREPDGWCDDPKSGDYNQHITLPSAYSYERLWRKDHCYDLIVPLGYNDAPVAAGKGSAIFLHCMHDDARPTEGCVALTKSDLLEVLADCSPATLIHIDK